MSSTQGYGLTRCDGRRRAVDDPYERVEEAGACRTQNADLDIVLDSHQARRVYSVETEAAQPSAVPSDGSCARVAPDTEC